MAYKKRSESLDDMLAEVINMRRVVPKEYEIKLMRFYGQRAKNMQRGIFDGVKLPEVKPNIGNLIENLHENRKLTEQVEYSAKQYFAAKSAREHHNDELKDLADSLKKVAEIEQIIRNDGIH